MDRPVSGAWDRYLADQRLGAAVTQKTRSPHEPRTDFQRDFDRIAFSTAFRRLHDKTQVFPLPENDLVHSRLTHSLEVSCVGRSLGTMVGTTVLELHPELKALGHTARDFGDIVAAACLAHDIGNPPFGHAGEDAIGSWFDKHPEVLNGLSAKQQKDLVAFEGNAQGFRILTRLQIPSNPGLQLTAATLAAFTKYPRESGPRQPGVAGKKHGFFQAEADFFREVAAQTGLLATGSTDTVGWSRHPLAFLVEAADDICYSILDIEDGFRLGLVSFDQVQGRLEKIALRDSKSKTSQPADDQKERISYLRAKAINQLAYEVKSAFLDQEANILSGTLTQPLAKLIPSAEALEEIGQYTRTTCYQAKEVIEIELAGYEVLHALLGAFVPAILKSKPDRREEKLLALLPRTPSPDASPYQRLLLITDHLSGMTDSYAVTVFRKLRGLSLPSR